jgi:hypothetical protein
VQVIYDGLEINAPLHAAAAQNARGMRAKGNC